MSHPVRSEQNGSRRYSLIFDHALPATLAATMVVLHLHGQLYPLIAPESLVLLGLAIVVGLAIGLFLHRSERFWAAMIVGALLAIFLNHIVEWQAFDIRSRYSVPASFLIGFALRWILGKNLHLIGTFGAGAMMISTVVMPPSSPIEETIHGGNPSAFTAEETARPAILHLILDEHIGIGGLPPSLPESEDVARDLTAFYIERGFLLFPKAFSGSGYTTASITDMLNFGTVKKDGGLVNAEFGHAFVAEKTEYFRRLNAAGYKISVFQTDYGDFCHGAETTISRCLTVQHRALHWMLGSDIGIGDRFSILASYFLNRSTIYQIMITGLNRLGTDFPIAPIYYTPLSALETMRLMEDAIAAMGPGEMLFAHILIPHFPHVFDAQCRMRNDLADWYPQDENVVYHNYLEQVRCTTNLIGQLLDAVDKNPELEDAVIVLHGDHGARILDNDIDQFSTLFAVRRQGIVPGVRDDFSNTLHLLVREVAQPLGISTPPIPQSSVEIKRKAGNGKPLVVDTMRPF